MAMMNAQEMFQHEVGDLVDRPRQRDIYVPFDAIQEMTSDSIMLIIPADQIDNMSWERPPLA